MSSFFVVIASNGSLYKGYGPCTPGYIFDGYDNVAHDVWSILVTHFTSIFFLLMVLILHVVVRKLRSGSMGKFWIVFAVISMLNYVWAVGYLEIVRFNQNLRDSPEFLEVSVICLLFLELAVYIWLLIICMEIFMTIR